MADIIYKVHLRYLFIFLNAWQVIITSFSLQVGFLGNLIVQLKSFNFFRVGHMLGKRMSLMKPCFNLCSAHFK